MPSGARIVEWDESSTRILGNYSWVLRNKLNNSLLWLQHAGKICNANITLNIWNISKYFQLLLEIPCLRAYRFTGGEDQRNVTWADALMPYMRGTTNRLQGSERFYRLTALTPCMRISSLYSFSRTRPRPGCKHMGGDEDYRTWRSDGNR